MSSSSQCVNFFIEPADFLVILLPLKPALVSLFGVQLDHTFDNFDLQLGGMAEERAHNGLVPGSRSSGDVVVGLDEAGDLSFINFEHLGYLFDGYLGVVLEDGVDGDVLELLESSSHQLVRLGALAYDHSYILVGGGEKHDLH
jgi:hypothetical protein